MITKNSGPYPTRKRQTTIGESLARPILVESISSMKEVQEKEATEEGVSLVRKEKRDAKGASSEENA